MFKRISLGLLIAITLMIGFISATFAQRNATLAILQPFIVDIQQTIPFSLTFTLPDTGEVVTVPSELDVALSIQVKADGSVSPTVQVTESLTPSVTVSELPESGEALVDKLGLSYEIEADSEIEVSQWRVSENYSGNFGLTGELENLTSNTLGKFDVRIFVTLYDREGGILEAANGLIVLNEIDANQSSPFEVTSTTPIETVGGYSIQIQVE
jgi:hypothetical protein